MTAAPEKLLARPRQFALAREQRPGNSEARQRQDVNEAGERHRDGQRRQGSQPPRQIDQETNDRRENAERQSHEPEIVGRMANEGNVIGELRLGRVDEGRREQAWESDQNGALPDPSERRGAHVFPGEF